MRRVSAVALAITLGFIPSWPRPWSTEPLTSRTRKQVLSTSATPPTGPRSFACSGALIDRTAFLTAGHRFADYYRTNGRLPDRRVIFDQKPTAASTYIRGAVSIDPASRASACSKQNVYANDTNDIAVLHLTTDPGITPATLPAGANPLGSVPRTQTFDVVGFGSSVTFGGGAHSLPAHRPAEVRPARAAQRDPRLVSPRGPEPVRRVGVARRGGDSGGPSCLHGDARHRSHDHHGRHGLPRHETSPCGSTRPRLARSSPPRSATRSPETLPRLLLVSMPRRDVRLCDAWASTVSLGS